MRRSSRSPCRQPSRECVDDQAIECCIARLDRISGRRDFGSGRDILDAQLGEHRTEAIGHIFRTCLASLRHFGDLEAGIRWRTLEDAQWLATRARQRHGRNAVAIDVGEILCEPVGGIAIRRQRALGQPAFGLVGTAHEGTATALPVERSDDETRRFRQAGNVDQHTLGIDRGDVLDGELRVAILVRGFLLDQARVGKREQEIAQLADVGGIAVALGHGPALVATYERDERLVAGAGHVDRGDVVDVLAQIRDEHARL